MDTSDFLFLIIFFGSFPFLYFNFDFVLLAWLVKEFHLSSLYTV